MKYHLRHIAMFVLLTGGFVLLRPLSVYSATTSPLFKINLPKTQFDLNDFDPRDELNRPIPSVSKKHEMQTLFEQNVFTLFINNLTPAKKIMMALLTQSWNGTFGWLKILLIRTQISVEGWWRENKSIHFVGMVQLVNSIFEDGQTTAIHHSLLINFHSLTSSLLSSTTLLR